jgi:hypothetical protein
MGMGKGVEKTPVIMGLIVAAGCLLFALVRKMEQRITLSAGENQVTYKGVEQPVSEAFASIADYLVIAYFWNVDHWEQVVGDTLMIPGGEYSIQVTQDCIWSF